jgi:hypothetical protein
MAYEDFTTYTEVDTGGDISIAAAKITVDTMRRGEKSYCYKDYGAGHFGDYEFLVTAYCSLAELQASPISGASCSICDTGNTIPPYAGDGLNSGQRNMFIRTSDGLAIYCQDINTGNFDSYSCSTSTVYYLKIKRSGTTAYDYIYSDSARTNLLDTLSQSTQSTTYRYLVVIRSANSSTGAELQFTGYVENLDLQESTAQKVFQSVAAKMIAAGLL